MSFPSTHWSVLSLAADPSSVEARAALGALIERYWNPIYYYMRRHGERAADAQDLTQDFLAFVLERNFLARFKPGHGPFRSFLMLAMKRFLLDRRDRRAAQKRGGHLNRIGLDFEEAESRFLSIPNRSDDPESVFRRGWARDVFDRAATRLRNEIEGVRFAVFERVNAGAAYAEIARELGIGETDVTNWAHRTRTRLRELIEDELLPGVAGREALDEEVRDLFAALEG